MHLTGGYSGAPSYRLLNGAGRSFGVRRRRMVTAGRTVGDGGCRGPATNGLEAA